MLNIVVYFLFHVLFCPRIQCRGIPKLRKNKWRFCVGRCSKRHSWTVIIGGAGRLVSEVEDPFFLLMIIVNICYIQSTSLDYDPSNTGFEKDLRELSLYTLILEDLVWSIPTSRKRNTCLLGPKLLIVKSVPQVHLGPKFIIHIGTYLSLKLLKCMWPCSQWNWRSNTVYFFFLCCCLHY